MPTHPIDESSFRSRPSRRGSRPRTKIRPAHEDAIAGMVIGVDRGRYTVLTGTTIGVGLLGMDDGDERTITAMRARELGRERIVCGDVVDMVGDTSGAPGSLARIVRIQERRSVLRRTADDTDPYERIVVANADQMVIVTALADPEPRTRMIDRCVVAATAAGMDTVLCLTKADLADPEPLRALYEPVGVRVVVTQRDDAGNVTPLDAVRDALQGRLSVFVGHSGVGKSTLVNALVPAAERATGHVNAVTGRGRHTSTSAVAFRLPTDDGGELGWVIDTPGVRSFGLAHIDTQDILQGFEDLTDILDACPRGCTHRASAPDCALDEWLTLAANPEHTATGVYASRAARIISLRRLLDARADSSPQYD